MAHSYRKTQAIGKSGYSNRKGRALREAAYRVATRQELSCLVGLAATDAVEAFEGMSLPERKEIDREFWGRSGFVGHIMVDLAEKEHPYHARLVKLLRK